MTIAVNLDLCVWHSIQAYPYILGNLMANDYIRGLTDNRIPYKEFLSYFQNSLNAAQRAAQMKHRILKFPRATELSVTNPQGAALVYSQWLTLFRGPAG